MVRTLSTRAGQSIDDDDDDDEEDHRCQIIMRCLSLVSS
jgi:hypothetical protein